MRRLLGNVAMWVLSLWHRTGEMWWCEGDRYVMCTRCRSAIGIRRRWRHGLGDADAPAVAGACPVARLYRWSRGAPTFIAKQRTEEPQPEGPFR